MTKIDVKYYNYKIIVKNMYSKILYLFIIKTIKDFH